VIATRGNALAGSLAATLTAIELEKWFSGAREYLAAGREVLFDARAHALSVSRFVRNAQCRFDHETWSLQPSADVSLRDALGMAGEPSAAWLTVPEESFVSRLGCARCGFVEESTWRLRASLDESALRCPRCAGERVVRGFDLVERLSAAAVPEEFLARPLSTLGLRGGEVFLVGEAGGPARHFALGADASDAGASVFVAGLGNIGSHLVPLLARIRGIERAVLCDPDTYEPEQVASQDIRAHDVGHNKARVQAERLRALRPDLTVEAFAVRAEAVPLGALWRAVTVSCLDSVAARVRLASRAWRVGGAFVDAAVAGGDGLMVRTEVYLPDPGAACFECAIEDYTQLDQSYPCQPGNA
jgi:molybdopterin/thiamine biosynthesis adenylyltransferase